MKIFLTGATGYIGSAVAARLQGAGHEVLGLARSAQASQALQARRITPILGDLDDLGSLTAGAKEADGVIQAAFKLEADIDASVAAERNAVTTLIDALRGTSKPLVFTSGTAVLGDTGSLIYEEDTPIAPHPFRGRLETEALVLETDDLHGIVLRPPNVYGKGDGHGVLTILRHAGRKLGAVPYAAGSGDHLWSFVHIDDLAELFLLALTKSPRGQRFHAGAQSGVRTQSIAEAVSNGIGLSGATVEVSIGQLRNLFPAPPLADYWILNSQSSSGKAKQLLAWKPEHLDMLHHVATHQLPAID
jgi:nucleoside-diphosphate-sugar epimerase